LDQRLVGGTVHEDLGVLWYTKRKTACKQFLGILWVDIHLISVCKMGIFADIEHSLQLFIEKAS